MAARGAEEEPVQEEDSELSGEGETEYCSFIQWEKPGGRVNTCWRVQGRAGRSESHKQTLTEECGSAQTEAS